MRTKDIFLKDSGKKNLLILAHYYHPDVASTGQILKEQAEGMLSEFNITVICVVPSYTGEIANNYRTKKYYYEEINGVRVIRIRVPEFTKTNKFSRIKNIISYFFGALGATIIAGKYDVVLTISQPPILGGLLGILAKWKNRCPLIYVIQDFNPEQTINTNYSKNKLILAIMMWFDKLSCRESNKIILVGRDMIETLQNRFKNKRIPSYAFINNWIDEKLIYPLPSHNERVMNFKKKYGLLNKYIIMYSGNLGLYYDLENLISVFKSFPPGTKSADGREVVFAFVGEGSLKIELINYKDRNKLDNVIFIPYQDKDDLIYSLNASDCHLCNSSIGIKGVSVPSKLYGIMAVGKPVLGVLEEGSEARLLLEETSCGLVSDPSDYVAFRNNISKYLTMSKDDQSFMGMSGRKYLEKNLTKDVSIGKYIKEIKAIIN